MSPTWAGRGRSLFWQVYILILAALILCQLALGWYMTRLDFYHRWYHSAPAIHKSVGLLTMALVLVRLAEKLSRRVPPARSFLRSLRKSAYGTDYLFIYILILFVSVTGYSFATAKGNGISFFGIFQVPPLIGWGEAAQKTLDRLHYLLAWGAFLVIIRHSVEKGLHAVRRKKRNNEN